ncbi:hypothetical protein N8739_01470 [Luminiphilus sp.]|jgi:hypothetical protein|nr:hypothetical protein [Luminiphilus sp.]
MTKKQLMYLGIGAVTFALLPLPYGYYMLLRVFMCGLLAYLAYSAIEQGHTPIAWLCGIAAVIYNPIVPAHLGREVWSIINIGTIGLLGYTSHSFSISANALEKAEESQGE